MKLTLNFKLGVPSLNQRIYHEREFIPALQEFLKLGDNAFVTNGYRTDNVGAIAINKIVGIATGYEILIDGTVTVDIKWLDTDEYKNNKKKINKDTELSSNVIGSMNPDKSVSVEKMMYLFIMIKDTDEENEDAEQTGGNGA
ncbi:MAG: hypothetical protein KAS32_22955 [Candidatus Peribacteraceae bacterium]|nr:hypothetical protein [Candidatus Peribacteraceae bacterium]